MQRVMLPMELLLHGILHSNHNTPTKKAILKKISEASTNSENSEELIRNILSMCVDAITDGADEGCVVACQEVFVEWARHNNGIATYFDSAAIFKLMMRSDSVKYVHLL